MTHSRNFRLIVIAFLAITGLVLGKPGKQEKLAPLHKASFLVEVQPSVGADGRANLSRNFVVHGLDGKEEVRQLVMALNNPLRNQLKILSEKIVPLEPARKKNPKN